MKQETTKDRKRHEDREDMEYCEILGRYIPKFKTHFERRMYFESLRPRTEEEKRLSKERIARFWKDREENYEETMAKANKLVSEDLHL